jgi:hypothetical protein
MQVIFLFDITFLTALTIGFIMFFEPIL